MLPGKINTNITSRRKTDQDIISEFNYMINCGDCVDNVEVIFLFSNSHVSNKHENTDCSEFKSFWDALKRVIGLYGSGYHI